MSALCYAGFINPPTGKDEAEDLIKANSSRVKTEVKELCARELLRIGQDTTLRHLIKEKAEK
ncbi:hypothetical protein PK28_18305 (plasmid) [Hymenobacter sp. DG25B]|uniref:hypothetical protein n=1 Tax=Hymenobacter sp. DG25B TaxID=1385664 RepID=UPI0005411B82|nr:hypothetical protein [Hymenobacter sp. DG25B]AIZ65572.1 hypothetical protein PK28_18305 [Hymenobacter sp. DG25B]